MHIFQTRPRSDEYVPRYAAPVRGGDEGAGAEGTEKEEAGRHRAGCKWKKGREEERCMMSLSLVLRETQLKIQPGEKFRDFNRRVDDQMRETLLHIAREGRSTSLKRKRQREKQKVKSQEKREKILEETRARDWDDLKDEVRFGEVVEAPPTLTAVPKARKKAKMDLPSPQITSNDPSDACTTSAARSPTDKRQWRSRNLSEAAKQVLKQERERVVAEYRAAKAKRLAVAGLTPLVTTRLAPLVAAGVTPLV
ncbi:hypothetical protein BC937DRAFT_90531 [Endogone sp. FLAS-F59071]|nr:hypothetical protein BC937DRAFT_90531 [Endogone sp. FLAS-F59071]|eukprot:RUS17013.1 hypothetical protein BC937DRAFT_90531 [Endogone sp. FLAS-F59071]